MEDDAAADRGGLPAAGEAGDRLIHGVTFAGLTLLWISAVLTLYTGYDYFRAGGRHLVEGEKP